MRKGIIVIKMPDTCLECPMSYHAEDLDAGEGLYKRLYRCRMEPEDLEEVYLKLNGKTDWCPIRPMPEKANHKDYWDNGRYNKGWNECIEAIEHS